MNLFIIGIVLVFSGLSFMLKAYLDKPTTLNANVANVYNHNMYGEVKSSK